MRTVSVVAAAAANRLCEGGTYTRHFTVESGIGGWEWSYQMTFGAKPDKNERSSQCAPVSWNRVFNHSAAMPAPEENECRLTIPDLPSSPVRKRMSFCI